MNLGDKQFPIKNRADQINCELQRPRGQVSPRPGMGMEGRKPSPFERLLKRDGKLKLTAARRVMDRAKCESQRDTPTWLGLSETENEG